MGFLSSVAKHPVAWGVGGASLAVAAGGAYLGGSSYKQDEEQGFHVKRAGAAAASFGLTAVPMVALGYYGRRPLGAAAKAGMSATGSRLWTGWKNQTSSYRAMKAAGTPGAFTKAFATTGNMMGVGALAGGVIGGLWGSRNDDTVGGAVKGAAIGAGVGVAGRAAMQYSRAMKAVTGVPGVGKAGKWGMVGLASAALFGLGSRMAGEGSNPIAEAGPSMTGAVEEYGAPGDYKGRMQAMGASGDIVLGSHRGRHGR